MLADCLETLAAQTALTEIEVLIIDDGSPEPLEESVPVPIGLHGRVRFVRLAGVGANAARNVGVRSARAPIVAFLDDDTLLAPSWAKALIDSHVAQDWDGVAGRILLRYESTPPKWLEDNHGYLSALDLGEEARWHTGRPYATSANCAVTRRAFDAVGGFREDIDRKGGSLLSGGETEFYIRLEESGSKIWYEPSACVEHRISAERLRLSYFLRRGRAQGVTDGLMDPNPRLRRQLTLLGWSAKIPLIAVKGLFRQGTLAEARIWTQYCRGRWLFERRGNDAARLV